MADVLMKGEVEVSEKRQTGNPDDPVEIMRLGARFMFVFCSTALCPLDCALRRVYLRDCPCSVPACAAVIHASPCRIGDAGTSGERRHIVSQHFL